MSVSDRATKKSSKTMNGGQKRSMPQSKTVSDLVKDVNDRQRRKWWARHLMLAIALPKIYSCHTEFADPVSPLLRAFRLIVHNSSRGVRNSCGTSPPLIRKREFRICFSYILAGSVIFLPYIATVLPWNLHFRPYVRGTLMIMHYLIFLAGKEKRSSRLNVKRLNWKETCGPCCMLGRAVPLGAELLTVGWTSIASIL